MAAAGNIANVDSTQTLLNLLGAVKGSSSSVTTSPNVSAAGMNQILQQILQQAPGITSQAKNAGMYNSSTQLLLNNDFTTRAAGELAKQQAGSTTTTKKAPQVSGNNILMGLGLLAGKSLLGPTIAGIGKKSGVDQFGNKIADSLGVGSSSADVATNVNANAPSATPDAMDLFSGYGGVGDSLSDVGSSIVDQTGTNLFEGASNAAGGSATDTVVGAIGDSAEEEGGSFLGSLFG